MIELIKVCPCHTNQVPLLWTFKFPGAEYWCPFCGYTCGMFGQGSDVPETDELREAYEDFSVKAESFLSGETEAWVYGNDPVADLAGGESSLGVDVVCQSDNKQEVLE